jgi:hypothetical protein
MTTKTSVPTEDENLELEARLDHAPAPADRPRLPRRPRHFAPYRAARIVLVALALIGAIAIALLVLGLLHVHFVTSHIRIH